MKKLGLCMALALGLWSASSRADSACETAATQKDMAAILTQCHELAASGDAFANYLMGYATLSTRTSYFSQDTSNHGFELSTDERLAFSDAKGFLKSAAEQGDVPAAGLLGSVMLATLYAIDGGQSVNIGQQSDQAYIYLKFAADQGDKPSVMQLADASVIYSFEQPHQVAAVRQQYEGYLRAVVADAELNTPYWQTRLRDYETYQAQVLAMQQDVTAAPPKDVILQALRLQSSGEPTLIAQGTSMLQQLSDKGNGDASYELAKSQLPKASKQDVLPLMEKAAQQKNHKAMLWLGDYFGCHKEPKKALQWYEKSKAAGNKDADFGINEIKQYGNVADCG